MAMHERWLTRAVLGAALVAGGPAAAAGCGAGAIDPRFHEAAAWCGDASASPAAPVAAVPIVGEVPRSVSVAMPAARAATAGMAAAGGRAPVARARRSHAAPAPLPAPLVTAISRHYRIDPHLFASMLQQESGGRLDAVSGKGALGLMQVMPATARSVGVRDPRAMLTDPVLALSAGAVYLKRLQAQFGNDVPLVLAAYNAGPGAVLKAGRQVPRYRETQGYVGAILTRWQQRRGR
jgi:soluble lytic murein transglycosylase-like protein